MAKWLCLCLVILLVLTSVRTQAKDETPIATICPSGMTLSSFPVVLRSPSKTNIQPSRCFVAVNSSRIIRLRTVDFSLGGQEPCSDSSEYLEIIFSPNSEFGRGVTDRLRWCKQSYGAVLETRDIRYIVYHPGPQEQRGAGFSIALQEVSDYSCGETDPIIVGDQSIYIYSPGFPDQYKDLLSDCEWTLRSQHGEKLLLDTIRFSLEPCSTGGSCYDYLLINNERYAGHERVQVLSRNNQINMSFITDNTKRYSGFALKIVELAGEQISCGRLIVAGTSPTFLRLPSQSNGFSCQWTIDSGSDHNVVLLDVEQYAVDASCNDFSLAAYDGNNTRARSFVPGCASFQPFQTIRSSGRYLLVTAELVPYPKPTSNINVTFSVLTSPIDAAPRVLYATEFESFIFLNLNFSQDLGVLLQSSNDDPLDYSYSISLSVQMPPDPPSSVPFINSFFMAFSGWNQSFAELGTTCGSPGRKSVVSYGQKIFLTYAGGVQPASVWLVYSLQPHSYSSSVMGVEIPDPQLDVIRNIWSDRSFYSVDAFSGYVNTTKGINYPSNSLCRWFIGGYNSTTFIEVKAIESSLHDYYCNDNVTAYDWSGSLSIINPTSKLLTWCANEKPTVLSSQGRGLLIEFVSNSMYSFGHFTFSYSAISLRNQCPSMAVLTAEHYLEQRLSSPNYPNNYPNNMECKWRITTSSAYAIRVVVNASIAKESRNQCISADSLAIYDGVDQSGKVMADLCGEVQNYTVVSSTNNVLVHFQSNSMITSKGFNLAYIQVDRPESQCGGTVFVTDSEDRIISSPSYPDPSLSQVTCQWLVLAPVDRIVMMEVKILSMPCARGMVTLFDGRSDSSVEINHLCNEQVQQPYYTSTQQAMYIHFEASSYSVSFQFRLRSWSPEEAGCNGGISHLFAYSTPKYFTSPQYPNNYPPSSDCRWRIEAVDRNMTIKLDVKTELESSKDCAFDYVVIYDGYKVTSPQLAQICGEHEATYWSSSKYLYVQFVSDKAYQRKGFRIDYEAVYTVPPTEAGSSYSSSKVGAVVGGVLGGLVFLMLCITAVMCVLVRSGLVHRPRGSTEGRRRSRRDSRREGRGHSTVVVMSPVIVNNNMSPPPYPGHTNHAFVGDDLPPAYSVSIIYGGMNLAPPTYNDMDAPPPYSADMVECYPPSSPTASEAAGLSSPTEVRREGLPGRTENAPGGRDAGPVRRERSAEGRPSCGGGDGENSTSSPTSRALPSCASQHPTTTPPPHSPPAPHMSSSPPLHLLSVLRPSRRQAAQPETLKNAVVLGDTDATVGVLPATYV